MERDFGWELLEDDIRDEPTFDDDDDDDDACIDEEEEDDEENDDDVSRVPLASIDRRPRAGTRPRSRRDGFEPTPTPATIRCADALADDDDDDERSMERRWRETRASTSTSRRAKRRRRGKDCDREGRSRAAAARAFARRVLSWPARGLRAGTREAVGEGILPRAMTTYESMDAWYATQEEVAFEEARATLAAALATSADAGTRAFDVDVVVVEEDEKVEDGEVMTILATPTSFTASDEWRKPATAILLSREDARTGVKKETFALVSARPRRETTTTTTTTREDVVPLVVLASDVFRDAKASARVSFRATPLDSLITHRRMAVACFTRPRVDFAHRVLGRRRAAHVKFIHSDDEEDAIVREEDAKDDPSSGDAFALPLNASQRDAAVSFIEERGDADRCRAVVGPPGTGKTRFAASLLARLVATNHRVLVCAPSNKAVCVVMEAYLRARRRRRLDEDDEEDDEEDNVALVGVEEALRDAATEASTMDHFIFQTCEVVARRLKETLDAYTRGEMNAVNVRDAGERARRRLRRRVPDFLAGDVADALDALRRAAAVDEEHVGTVEPELAIAFTRHPRRALLVGDPAQLPASLTSDIARRFGHATSLMERLTKTDADGARALNAQYRMHPEISSWPAREFYDGRVMNAPCVETRARPVGTPRWLPPYVFVDVADGAERGGRGKSKTNEREAQVACDVVARIRGDNDAAKVLSIVVITFYAAQVGRLREALSARGLRDVAVRSVDSFQGSEADVVVCSAVRNNPRFNVGFLADRRRLNVALTRAKHALVVVGSRETLARCDADALRRLVEDVDERGLVVSDKDIASSWR